MEEWLGIAHCTFCANILFRPCTFLHSNDSSCLSLSCIQRLVCCMRKLNCGRRLQPHSSRQRTGMKVDCVCSNPFISHSLPSLTHSVLVGIRSGSTWIGLHSHPNSMGSTQRLERPVVSSWRLPSPMSVPKITTMLPGQLSFIRWSCPTFILFSAHRLYLEPLHLPDEAVRVVKNSESVEGARIVAR